MTTPLPVVPCQKHEGRMPHSESFLKVQDAIPRSTKKTARSVPATSSPCALSSQLSAAPRTNRRGEAEGTDAFEEAF
jgi:hypothetical protein